MQLIYFIAATAVVNAGAPNMSLEQSCFKRQTYTYDLTHDQQYNQYPVYYPGVLPVKVTIDSDPRTFRAQWKAPDADITCECPVSVCGFDHLTVAGCDCRGAAYLPVQNWVYQLFATMKGVAYKDPIARFILPYENVVLTIDEAVDH